LAEIFEKHPQLQQAWDRGRFLRNLKDLARKGINVLKAATKLGFANGRVLQSMIDEDEEVGEFADIIPLLAYYWLSFAYLVAKNLLDFLHLLGNSEMTRKFSERDILFSEFVGSLYRK
jgi:hypothetical protein